MISTAKSERRKVEGIGSGFTMVEMLVVVLIFSVVGILVTRSIAVSLKNSRKSESVGKVRENVENAINIMERNIRNARDLDCGSSSSTKISFVDEDGNDANFECLNGFIDFNTDHLTNPTITVDCSTSVFSCNIGGAGVPPFVDININAQSNDLTGAEGFTVSYSTKILLRTY